MLQDGKWRSRVIKVNRKRHVSLKLSTFAVSSIISVSARFFPRQDRMPRPKGRYEQSWWSWSFSFSHLSGRYFSGSSKSSSRCDVISFAIMTKVCQEQRNGALRLEFGITNDLYLLPSVLCIRAKRAATITVSSSRETQVATFHREKNIISLTNSLMY